MARETETLFRGSFHRGIVRDTARHLIPSGGVYDAVDYWVHKPGVAFKRGGWEKHSADMDASGFTVGSLPNTAQLFAVDEDGTLWQVTSEGAPQADEIDDVGFASVTPIYFDEKAILCDAEAAVVGGTPETPMKVYMDGSTMTLDDLEGTPPAAATGCAWRSRLVLARHPDTPRRLWFSPIPTDPSFPDWNLSEAYIDATYEVTGLAAVSGVLLIFSSGGFERLLGGVPVGSEGEDIELQTVDSVGCTDARSIVNTGRGVAFANTEGVFITTGVGADPLMERDDGSGIASYWRTLFDPSEFHPICAGMLGRDLYVVSVLDGDDNSQIDTLACHLPSGAWARIANLPGVSYVQGWSPSDVLVPETYVALGGRPYIARLSSMLAPTAANALDGDSAAVLPVLEFPFGDAGALKSFAQGRVTHTLTAAS